MGDLVGAGSEASSRLVNASPVLGSLLVLAFVAIGVLVWYIAKLHNRLFELQRETYEALHKSNTAMVQVVAEATKQGEAVEKAVEHMNEHFSDTRKDLGARLGKVEDGLDRVRNALYIHDARHE